MNVAGTKIVARRAALVVGMAGFLFGRVRGGCGAGGVRKHVRVTARLGGRAYWHQYVQFDAD